MNVDLLSPQHVYNSGSNGLAKINPVVLITVTVILVFYYVVFSSLGVPTNMLGDGTPSPASPSMGVSIVELILWSLLIFLIMINGLQYFFSVDIKPAIKDIFSPVPEIDITITADKEAEEPVPEIMFEKQVFHVPDNEYTYEDAQAVCKAYGSRLASYEEVESAYNDGGEWCGYGWSQGQMALYPTQKKTFDKLQKKKGHEHDCGRPGVNGGYIANPNVRFGANCYGYKPEITQAERDAMDTTRPYPLTKKEKEFERKVEHYRRKLPDIMISPFNHNRWSII
jgi:hypothetical protein